jgi:hypothetical protein
MENPFPLSQLYRSIITPAGWLTTKTSNNIYYCNLASVECLGKSNVYVVLEEVRVTLDTLR